MKILFIILLLAAPVILKAQAVIQSQKHYAIYFDEVRQDTAIYELPAIAAGLSNDMIHKLSPYLSADSILGESIDSVISNFREYGAGITSSSYSVLYNQNYVLSISVYVETLGAYPDAFYGDINLNLATGNRILISDIIKSHKLPELAEKLNQIVQQRIKDKIKEENLEEDAVQFFEGDKFTVERLSNFAVKDGGIMFYFDYGLPHVVKALSPDEDIWMSNEELSEFYTEYGETLHQ